MEGQAMMWSRSARAAGCAALAIFLMGCNAPVMVDRTASENGTKPVHAVASVAAEAPNQIAPVVKA
jgi:hypothetical protein